MAEIGFIPPDLRALDDTPADVLIITAFADDRPLVGLGGLTDWRLCGALSAWRIGGFSTGALGERVLYPAGRRLSHPRVLLMGLGRRDEFRTERAFQVATSAAEAAAGLGVRSLTTELYGLDRLPSPLGRGALTLIEILRAAEGVERIQLVATPEDEGRIRDTVSFFT